jgi:hypothetical protein
VACEVFEAVADDFERVADSAGKAPSSENWRIEEQTKDWTKDCSAEVDLERYLVQARLRPLEWWNQIPIASGLGGGRRQCIDLVHARSAGGYDFVELKVKSNTPIYAAVEILQYGYFWLLSRVHRDRLGYSRSRRTLLDAKAVRLCVLAPQEFYSGFNLGGLESGVDREVAAIAERYQAQMGFRFFAFRRPEFPADAAALRQLLDDLFGA